MNMRELTDALQQRSRHVSRVSKAVYGRAHLSAEMPPMRALALGRERQGDVHEARPASGGVPALPARCSGCTSSAVRDRCLV